jgi:carboxymethylenebutenolidase
VGADLTLYVPGDPIPGYLAVPEGVGPWPGVVVLHEAFGLNDDIRRITDRVAGLGYLAVVPDLLPSDSVWGRMRCLARLFRQVQRGEPLPVVDGVVEWLARRTDCDGRVGAIGFCLGGSVAFLLACRGGVEVAAPNYGRVPEDHLLAASCPVVASYGGRDRIFTRQAPRARSVLAAHGIDHDVKVYPEAGHSFMNQAEDHRLAKALARPLMAVGFVRDDAEDAWARIEHFFARHLRPTPGAEGAGAEGASA